MVHDLLKSSQARGSKWRKWHCWQQGGWTGEGQNPPKGSTGIWAWSWGVREAVWQLEEDQWVCSSSTWTWPRTADRLHCPGGCPARGVHRRRSRDTEETRGLKSSDTQLNCRDWDLINNLGLSLSVLGFLYWSQGEKINLFFFIKKKAWFTTLLYEDHLAKSASHVRKGFLTGCMELMEWRLWS